MNGTIVTAIGLVLAIEGLTYALVPAQMKKMMAQLQNLSVEQLRITGTTILALGVCVVWIAHWQMGG
jgi:uncharacterized protein